MYNIERKHKLSYKNSFFLSRVGKSTQSSSDARIFEIILWILFLNFFLESSRVEVLREFHSFGPNLEIVSHWWV